MADFQIIDARRNPKGRSLSNERRYLEKQKEAMREAVRRKVAEGGLKELGSSGGKRLRMKVRGTEEPSIHHDPESGVSDRVFPGNKKYTQGDRIPRPDGGGGNGREGSPDGEGEDDFYFELSNAEFQEIVFEDLEIPNMVKRYLLGEDEFVLRNAGYAVDGPPNRMDPEQTLRRAIPRRIAFRLPYKRRKEEIEKEIRQIEEELQNGTASDLVRAHARIEELREELIVVERKMQNVPFLDKPDLRFRRSEREPIPVTQAVMFCMMDVSGSMEKWHKEMARRFFLLLYLFLRRNYDRVEVVFIRHTQDAKEVDEEEFFHGRESGGTIVSSALHLMKKIVDDRFPLDQWNIYGCHASDGEDWSDDLSEVERCLSEDIMSLVQYYAYVEVRQQTEDMSELWGTIGALMERFTHLAMAHISDAQDIYPVFRKLFEKERSAS
ncbi:MAG: YeaH/YhbH family protein [Parcubacteria group bacterium]|nr:YeaH/YhbH family protein [Parcubacteria group bacterium]